jgi:hypothetical protein
MDQLRTKTLGVADARSGCSVSGLSRLFLRKISGRFGDKIGEARDNFLYGTLVGWKLRSKATCLFSIL